MCSKNVEELYVIAVQQQKEIDELTKKVEQHERELVAVVNTLEVATTVIEAQTKSIKQLTAKSP